MEITPIQQRLQKILNILIQYHTHLLQKNTLLTQDPNTLIDLRTLLRKEGQNINHFILYGKYPQKQEAIEDPLLKETLTNLQEVLHPWNAEVSTLSEYWCKMMFTQYPFSISYDHMKNLYKNYGLPIEEDADTSESSSQMPTRDDKA